MRRSAVLSLLAAALLSSGVLTTSGAAHADESPPYRFHCDGQDPFFFEELNKAGTLAYGETWDHTLCDQGLEVYAEGTTSRWKAFRPKPRKLTKEQEYYASLMPVAGLASFGVIGAAVGVMALVSRRRRKVTVLNAPCPGCSADLPIVLDDPSTHSLFCPLCGTACRAEIQGKNGPVVVHTT